MFNRMSFSVIVLTAALAATAPAADLHVSPDGPYTTIQAAIDNARDGDTVTVQPGAYAENIGLDGKNLTLTSTDPIDWSIVAQTVISGDGTRAVVTFDGDEDAGCVLQGFTIRGGYAPHGGGVDGNRTLATIARCIVTGNHATGPGGGLHECNGVIRDCIIHANSAGSGSALGGCNAKIRNCIIRENTGSSGAAIHNCHGSITHCVITANVGTTGAVQYSDAPITNCIILYNSTPEFKELGKGITFSCFAGGDGNGNIDADPGFVNYEMGDFHLRPDSPCIDAGTNTPPGGLPPEDMEGGPRPTDGDFDGSGIADMGVYESPPSAAPVLSLSAAAYDIEALEDRADPAPRTLTIANSGGGVFDWTITGSCPWISLSQTTGSCRQDEDVITLEIDITDLTAGDYACELQIDAPAALNGGATVSVNLHIQGPIMRLSQARYDFFANDRTAPPGGVLRLSNDGGGCITWAVETDQAWLQALPPSGSVANAPQDIILVVDPAGLARGDHTCTLRVLAPGTQDGDAEVSVYLHIGEELLVPSEYPTIQSAIDAAKDMDTILVAPGTYKENINFGGKDIAVISSDVTDRDVRDRTVIDGDQQGSVVTFSGAEGPDCRLAGFTIRRGFTDATGGGIAGNGTLAGITHCTIEQNESLSNGGAIHACNGLVSHCVIRNNKTPLNGALAGCHGRIANCLITANKALVFGGLASTIHNCDGQIVNCTIADNMTAGRIAMRNCDGEIVNCIIWGAEASALVACSLPQNSCYPGATANGNIDADPRFLAADDYRLRRDSVCIDAGRNDVAAGLPAFDLDNAARLLDGNASEDAIVDMGAYEFDPRVGYMGLSTHALQFDALEGQPFQGMQTFQVENCGIAPLDWTITEPYEWLTVAPRAGQTGQAPSEITVTVDIPAYAKGKYACPLTISDPSASNSPKTITVTLYVRVEGQLSVPGIHATIQSAIDAAVHGDLIVVDDGVYSGEGNINIDFKGKAVTLRSRNGPENCTIDCQSAGRGFVFQNNEGPDSIVEGLTVKNGLALEDSYTIHGQMPYARGGAVCNIETSPTFVNCRFVGCDAVGIRHYESTGGGMYNYNASPTILGCRFTQNYADWGGALNNDGTSSPLLRNCIISGNRARTGAALFNGWNASGTLINCTLTGNTASIQSGGIYASNGLVLTNCIVWANTDGRTEIEYAQIDAGQSTAVTLRHNCIAGWTGRLGGIGNIGDYPHFVAEGHWMDQGTTDAADDVWFDGDYRLKSEGWRWDAYSKRWTYDDMTSPCIDAGNPGTPLGEEPLTLPADPWNDWGENTRVNMGAYGGTAEASMAPPGWSLLCDITNDHTVDLADLLFLAARWLRSDCNLPGWCTGADFDRNAGVAMPDLAALAQQWQTGNLSRNAQAHWRLDGNFYDSAGDHHGTPDGGPIFVGEHLAARGSDALSLNGLNQRVRFDGYFGIAGSRSRTLCAWIKTVDREGALVSWGPSDVPGGRWVWRTQADGFMRLEVGDGFIVGGAFVCDDQWHHVAVIFQSDETPNVDDIRFFVDGRDDPHTWVLPRTIDTVANAETPLVRIGVYNPIGYFYHGLIDDVRIYDRALTPEEIAEIAR